MSPTKGQLASAVETKIKAPVQPISILDTPAASAISLARPVVLIGLLALRFNALISDPVSTLQTALPVVAAIQVGYALLCLPALGSHHVKGARKNRPGERKKASDTSGPNSIFTAIFALLLSTISSGAVYGLFILFGAPFLDNTYHTLYCAAHFSLLALFPVFYVRGVDGQAFVALAGAYAPLDETSGGLLGALLGAWLGAVPIPLDWDREWQKWPVTIVVGMYLGYGIGSKLVGTVFFGKQLSVTQPESEE
ncbi:unnamed protein product [Clonostachys rhizophaga]|uniref:Glycosylphosphatidylinositol anchor biosynthesis protein 11 n=1 Tax=Clonostachys rhizophaga TaxID=160324 RepID=A0A9N9V7L9_9HYPO|nr:unnamed protein product [Clonostachys rhizophaga]